jgi:beta-1,4-mannosyltransferase
MKIIFAPHYSSNPYQGDLIKVLKESKNIHFSFVKSGFFSFLKIRNAKKVDIIHLHWFEKYTLGRNCIITGVKIMLFLFKLKLLKRQTKIVWTVHNLNNHEKAYPVLERFFLKRYINLIDAFSVHNKFTVNVLVNKYNVDSKKIYLIPHANYIGVYAKSIKDDFVSDIEKLGLDKNKFTYMIMGNIRPYKGVLDVVKVFKDLNDEEKQLVICGRVYSNDEKEVILKEVKNVENIFFIPEFIKDEYLLHYLDYADVMVYSYKDILTSGALILGMSLGKVCIASSVGSMSELLDEEFLFKDQEDLKKVLKKVSTFTKEELEVVGKKNFKKVKDNTWMKTGELTFNMYKGVLSE